MTRGLYTMAKPDNRYNNAERLEQMVNNTIENLEEAHKTLQNEDLNKADRDAIEAKNARREQSIDSFKAEIEDEVAARENGEI
uniref:Small, acid-soluble spore protein Tlp n=2 Tax=Anaerobacillus isosaccharinicus TaxID=1532552 RepID=A0A1S2LQ07_9BACI